MHKGVLVVAGLVVVAGVVALLLMLGGSDDKASASPQPSSAVVTATPPPMGTGPSAPTVTPSGDTHAPSLPTGDAEHPRDYAVGDVRIRDHRAGTNEPIDVPPNVHPAEGREIPSTLTHDIAQKLKAVMKECTADVPKDARGPKPRLEGQVKIAIKDGKVTVTNAFMQLRDMLGDTVDATKKCIEQKAVGIENPAADQPDLEDYDIHITFAIP